MKFLEETKQDEMRIPLASVFLIFKISPSIVCQSHLNSTNL